MKTAFPLKVSANRRYLVDARNRPFFYQADTPWMLLKLKPEEVDEYLDDRKARGFTALQIMLTCFIDMRTYDGLTPFGRDNDLARPNEAYFARADAIIKKATDKGFLLAIAPLWSGSRNENWTGLFNGKWKPLNVNGPKKAREFGRWLGARYADYPNIIWIMGGDHNPDQSFEAICELAAGIHEKAPHQLMTVHNAPDNSSAAFYDEQPWLGINGAYSYRELQTPVYKEWNRLKNVRPILLLESGYEHEANDGRGGTPFRVRRQVYAAVLNGALVGTAYGHRDIWKFSDQWRTALADPGATQVGLAQRFFSGRPWWKLEPDQGGDLVTEGRGKVDADDYVSAARATDGSLVIAYLPNSRPVTVNMARLAGPVKAIWYDPTDGSNRAINRSPLSNQGIRRFVPPGHNASGENDWVLVLEGAKTVIPEAASALVAATRATVAAHTPHGGLALMRTAMRIALASAVVCVVAGHALPVTGGDVLPGRVVHSWLANSFATQKGHQWVPVTASAIAVTPDGTVFSAGVAEGYGGVASYKDGTFVTKYDYDSGFGSSASAVAVDDSYVYIGTGVGLFRTRRGDEAYNRTPVTTGDIHGLALRDDELYLSDSAAGKIRILATATMKEVRSFAVPSPGPIAVGVEGRVWVVQGKQGKEPFDRGGLKIVSFSKDGQPGPEITDFESPCALTFDAKGHLLVGGLNRHSQIWIYDVAGIPKKVGTFGTEGGVFSGQPGRYGPQKLTWIRGLGLDAAGNLYIACVFGSWYNALIEAYSPAGRLLWTVYGLGNWLDTACLDPANESVAYTKENVFDMDWGQPPGREQSLAGLTVDRFTYPLDPRVTDGHGPSHRLINGVRRIGGKLFLYCGGQGTSNLEVYKFGGNGCVAAPCGYVAGASTWRPGNGKRWPEDAEAFIWRDANGNGAPDAAEFASVDRKPRWGFMHLDAAAGIWQCSGDGTIFYTPCEGLDPRGNPIYRRASEVSFQYPPEFTGDRLRRLFYVPGDDVMIAGGSPGTEENACNLLIRFDHWSDPARRTKRWTLNLPLNDKSYTPDTGYGGGAPVAMQARGRYLFVAYGYGLIRVHRLDDGSYVGTIRPDINGFKGSGGCVDSDNALNVTLRKNGEYVFFLENAGLNHVMMFRWIPPAPE